MKSHKQAHLSDEVLLLLLGSLFKLSSTLSGKMLQILFVFLFLYPFSLYL